MFEEFWRVQQEGSENIPLELKPVIAFKKGVGQQSPSGDVVDRAHAVLAAAVPALISASEEHDVVLANAAAQEAECALLKEKVDALFLLLRAQEGDIQKYQNQVLQLPTARTVTYTVLFFTRIVLPLTLTVTHCALPYSYRLLASYKGGLC